MRPLGGLGPAGLCQRQPNEVAFARPLLPGTSGQGTSGPWEKKKWEKPQPDNYRLPTTCCCDTSAQMLQKPVEFASATRSEPPFFAASSGIVGILDRW